MIKAGVDLRGLAPQWGVAYPIIQEVYQRHGYQCVVTSASDGTHMPTSLHYHGKALDFRTKLCSRLDLPKIVAEVKEELGSQFDVVMESAGFENEHLHVEFDVKEPEEAAEA